MKFTVPLALLATLACLCGQLSATEIPPIKRLLPPEGLEIPADVRERLETRLATTKKRMEAMQHLEPLLPDVEIFTKAVELALLHREFYVPKDFAKADWALDQANERLDGLSKGQTPWIKTTGLVVRGYRSIIDGSAQPYGLVIPKDHDFDKPCPLYVWLHGRGDKNTDLHFLQERATKIGQIAPSGAIVLHPFGRHCVGYKNAGEFDVIEAIGSVRKRDQHKVDRNVLVGFSMGGAGAWHLGAHYPWIWRAVSPGAGFAETARYQRLTPDKYPPSYEQKLWGQYDVPNYVRNLFNVEVVAYSGELDKQIQAARVMEEAYSAEGRKLTHLIGPGVEHKYEPKTLESLLGQLADAAAVEPDRPLKKIHLQTQTLRYSQLGWIAILQLEEHWKDSRVDAEIVSEKDYRIATKNIAKLALDSRINLNSCRITIDGTTVPMASKIPVVLAKKDGKWEWDRSRWKWGEDVVDAKQLSKRPGFTGPIDDAFSGYDLERSFLVVVPSGKSKNPAFQAWQDFELAHFLARWRALMRGEARVKLDTELTPSDWNGHQNLIVWGDPDSNAVLSKMMADLPVSFSDGAWKLGSTEFDGNRYVPVMIFPRKNAKSEFRSYVVLNSGLTFREGHDRTNSLQNPKLPDWAIIDMTQPPDAFAPGRIHDAGFFDEEWKLKGPVKGP
jgi:pimeloyl-ACP methyl ester carboxylesterase